MPFQKGHKFGKGMPKGHKTAKVIAREDARKVFEETQMIFWDKITFAQAKRALRDRASAEYTINQVIGKPKETVEHTGEVSLRIDV